MQQGVHKGMNPDIGALVPLALNFNLFSLITSQMCQTPQKEQTLLIFPHLPWFGHHETQSTELLAKEMQHSNIE